MLIEHIIVYSISLKFYLLCTKFKYNGIIVFDFKI